MRGARRRRLPISTSTGTFPDIWNGLIERDEMAYEDLIHWANGPKCRAWQKEALRIIGNSEEITSDLLDHFRNIIENDVGIENNIDESTMKTYRRDILEVDFRGGSSDEHGTALNSIGPVCGFDRLANDQAPLTFLNKGLTIVYGPNASGKSGYCRIAKQLCRSLKKQPLKGNIYEDDSSSTPEVEFSYSVEGKPEVNCSWKKGDISPYKLSRISVFDTKSANVYVDEGREIEFLPYELSILKELTNCMESIETYYKEKRDDQKRIISLTRPSGYHDGTKVSNMIKKLSSCQSLDAIPRENEIEALADWSNEKKSRLEEVENEIRSDPNTQLTLCRSIRKDLDTLVSNFSLLRNIMKNDYIIKIIDSYNTKNAKEEAANNAAKILFSEMSISDTGSNAWKEMFATARKYASGIFPDGTDISTAEICVLCQQTLGEDGKARMAKFDEFISQETTKESSEANKIYEELVAPVMTLTVMKPSDVKSLLESYKEMGGETSRIVTKIVSAYEEMNENITSIRAAIKNNQLSNIKTNDTLLDDIERTLSSTVEGVDERMESLVAAIESKGDNIDALRREETELKDMRELSNNVKKVFEFRNSIEKIIMLGDAIDQCKTLSISRLVTNRRRELLTEDLEESLFAELSRLKASHIPIRVTDSSARGVSRIKVELEAQGAGYGIDDILSEGEHRALALACFFAELKEIDGGHGIIIDDPVSSLDSSRMQAVAGRIVEEAITERQVIVFTHSIPFCSMIEQEARNREITPSIKTISSYHGKKFGIIDAEDVFSRSSKSVEKRIKDIQKLIDGLRENNYDPNQFKFQWKITEIYTYMRETWERVIEYHLFNEAILRFRPGIQTQRLRKVLYNDEEDYKVIERGMASCSRYSGHDLSEELPQVLPYLEEINKDFEEIKSFYDDLTKRQKRRGN